MKLIVGLDLGTSTTVAYYRMEGSKEAPHALVDERTSTIPTLLFRREGASQPTEYGVNAEKSVRLQRKGTLIQNFKMDLLKPAGSEERQAAEAHIKEFLSRHIFRLLWDQTLSLNFDTVLLYVSYPAKWTPGMSEFMEEIVKEAAQESDKPRRDIQIEVKGVTEPEAATYNFVVNRRKQLAEYGFLQPGQITNVFMLDMGAGTSDIVIFQLSIDTDGVIHIDNAIPYPRVDNPYLCGGNEIDRTLQEYITDYFAGKGIDILPKENFRLVEVKDYKEIGISEQFNKSLEAEFPANLRLFVTQCFPQRGLEAVESFRLDKALFEQITHEHWEKLYALIEAAMLNYPYAHAEDIDLLCLTGGHSQWYLVENLFNGRGIGTLGRAGEENNHVCFSKLIRENWRISSIKEPYPQISVAQGMCHIGNHITFNHRSANNVWIQFAINDKESAREKVMDFSQELPYNTDLEMKLGTISQQYTKETNDDYRGYIKVYTGTTPDEDNFEIIPLSFTTGFLAAILNVKYDVQAQIKLTVEDNNIIRVNGHLILTPQTSHIWRKIINTKDIAFEKSNRTDTGEQTI